jgi:Type IV leader peptidase family
MYAQVLMAASFAGAAYQDVRERGVSDVIWAPALVGAVYALYLSGSPSALEFQILKIALIGGIALVATLIGVVGQADSIALIFVAADPYPLSPLPILIAAAVLALSHIAYEYAVGNARGGQVIPIEKFLHEQRWIPKAVVSAGARTEVNNDVNAARDEVEAMNAPGAMVEVAYGVPTVAYLGLGYLAFLGFLVLFDPAGLASVP